MRIISKFHDYYDKASAYGSDEDCVYVRHTTSPLHDKCDGGGLPWFHWPERSSPQEGVDYKQFWIGFCGKVYYGVFKEQFGKDDEVFYGQDAIDQMEWFLNLGSHKKESKYWRRFSNKFNRITTSDDIRRRIGGKWPEKFKTYEAPIVVIAKYPSMREYKVTINNSLLDFSFGKVVESNQAYQQIQYYLMNDLNPGMEMPDFGDEYKLKAHGMDKSSFKREPGGPTRKRKKALEL
jgi:hypothetical protein